MKTTNPATGIRPIAGRGWVVVALSLLGFLHSLAAGASPNFTVLHSFSSSFGSSDGSSPFAGLIFDGADNLYGTTETGGNEIDTFGCGGIGVGCGTVFSIKTDGTGFTVLHAFGETPTDGELPLGGLILDGAGNLFGTTEYGGNTGPSDPNCGFGCGTVFKIKTNGTGYTILHAFTGEDGSNPTSGLILDSSGNLYGTAGNVFTLKTDGTGFSRVGAGQGYSTSPLSLDANGNLYGATVGKNLGTNSFCFPDCGTVFRMRTNGTEFRVLYLFSDSNGDGANPVGGLTLDASGTLLYGTTEYGGAHLPPGCPNGCGTVFEVKTDGTGYTILHSFSGTDGAYPVAGMIFDDNGILYGTTGAGAEPCFEFSSDYECGTIFRISTVRAHGAKFTLLYSFSNGSIDGANPVAALALDGAGNLYGTTLGGGTSIYGSGYPGYGTVFRFVPPGAVSQVAPTPGPAMMANVPGR